MVGAEVELVAQDGDERLLREWLGPQETLRQPHARIAHVDDVKTPDVRDATLCSDTESRRIDVTCERGRSRIAHIDDLNALRHAHHVGEAA